MKIYHTTGGFMQRIAWFPLKILFKNFTNLQIQGLENINKLESNVIFASNHSSELDPLIIVSCLPWFSRHIPLIFVSGDNNFYKDFSKWKNKVYGGILFKLIGAFPAYSGLNNYDEALAHHIKALQCGYNVCIFPMGKRHLNTDLHQAKAGVSYLAKKTGLPILPIKIVGAENIRTKELFFGRRNIQVIFGKPIYFEEISETRKQNSTKKDYENASTSLMQKIMNLDLGN